MGKLINPIEFFTICDIQLRFPIPIQQENASLKEGRHEKTDYSKMKANKEEVDVA